MKNFMKNAVLGIAVGCTIFTVMGIVFDIIFSGGFSLANWGYTKMAAGSMVVGMGFSIPTAIYRNDNMSYALKILIHMGIGCTIMLVVAFVVGWIPAGAGWKLTALVIGAELLAAFLIWLGFSLYYRQLAKKMNTKIKDIQDSH